MNERNGHALTHFILRHTLLGLTFVLLFQNCAKENFSAAGGGGNANQACVNPGLNSITKLTKILFVVDTSGSNAYPTRSLGSDICFPGDPDYNQCTPASDPDRGFRGGAIQNFFSTYQAKTNFQFGFETFSQLYDSNSNPIGSPARIEASFGSGNSGMQSALTNFKNFADVVDNGSTPYKAALSEAKQEILSDGDLNSAAAPNYDVILITDGFPSDYLSTTLQGVVTEFASSISDLTSAAPGRVFLSTVYYGHVNDANAIALLQTMAQEGQGQFANVNDPSTSIRLDNVVPGATQGGCP